MGYSDNDASVEVLFFRQSGKWYTTEAVIWTGMYGSGLIHEEFAISLRDHFNEDPYKDASTRLSDMDAICPEPYHKDAHPICIKNGEWLNKILTEGEKNE